jgi:TusA-related sulfurtransferase
MADQRLDAKGLKCPQPILKVAAVARSLSEGDVLEVLADCPSFPKDIEAWCDKTGRTLLNLQDDGNGSFTAEIEF